VDKIMLYPEGTKLQLLAPIVRGRKGEHLKEFERARKSGYVRVRADGNMYDLSEEIKLDKNKKHNIEIVVDRLVVKEGIQSRLTDSLETVMNISGGIAIVDIIDGEEMLFSQNYACPEHNISIEELTPRMFSFNNPFGACPECTGLGVFQKIDPELVVPNKDLSIKEGAIKATGWNVNDDNSIDMMYYRAIAEKYDVSLTEPVKNIPEEKLNIFLYGTKGEKLNLHRVTSFSDSTYQAAFEGVINNLERRYNESGSDYSKEDIGNLMSEVKCPCCNGKRLKKESLAVTVGGMDIMKLCDMSVKSMSDFFANLKLTKREEMIGEKIIKEINARLGFLNNVGLDYLTLSRSSGTLSGGESQRIRLATQIGSALVGVLYILDEPSIGLHQRDKDKLIATLKKLRDGGNTVIVVEHDEDTMRAADYIVDIGPKAGVHGGEVVCAGDLKKIMSCKNSLTGQYLSGKKKIPVPTVRRKGNGNILSVYGCEENNLKKINVHIPLGTMTCVTGVSGSGKSSLVNEIIYKHLASKLNRAKIRPGKFDSMEGIENLDKVINIDQSPIGRTTRSNHATYTGVFTDIRELFASTNDAKMKGYSSGRFSFNVKGGRCEACQGDGIIEIEMHFLPDIYVPCEVCKGKRYNRETLDIHYKGKSIYDVLEMTVDEGVEFFANMPKISRKLKTLQEVGLGYIKIGQPATTLSGGEAQRVKLATELSKRSTGKTIYILDEPTTGLHSADVHKLTEVLQRLVDGGNTVLLIEHNLDIIKTSDHLIDLGPEGGDKGGEILICGTPEEIADCEKSYTGEFL
ncbi:MAG: excinuclease ABC subunit UvrA, partial [Oscillospiraceae bacterium]|nr:excinuclease ABC subunit UvrA [Oscillospiraceae bacterium]